MGKAKIGENATEQHGLKPPADVPHEMPPEPPCTNETCIICYEGTIQSAINPGGCRHAFSCDRCLARLHRCAMCQQQKTGFQLFSALVPPVSATNPVYHAV